MAYDPEQSFWKVISLLSSDKSFDGPTLAHLTANALELWVGMVMRAGHPRGSDVYAALPEALQRTPEIIDWLERSTKIEYAHAKEIRITGALAESRRIMGKINAGGTIDVKLRTTLLETIDDLSKHLRLVSRAALPDDGSRQSKGRAKRKVAEPLIAEHLTRKPYDTAQQVSDAAGCSKGVVIESPAWKANQKRLKDSRHRGKDPIALQLSDYLTTDNENKSGQMHGHTLREEALDAEIEQRQKELNYQINEYQKQHPDAQPKEIAKATGCAIKDVVARDAELDHLAEAQRADNQKTHQTSKPIWTQKP